MEIEIVSITTFLLEGKTTEQKACICVNDHGNWVWMDVSLAAALRLAMSPSMYLQSANLLSSHLETDGSLHEGVFLTYFSKS